MASFRKFTFDVDFDAPESRVPRTLGAGLAWMQEGRDVDPAALAIPEPEPEPEPEPPPPPTFSEEEMESARAEAYVAGRTAALNDSASVTAQALADALAAVGRALNGLPPVIADAAAGISELSAHVAIELCRKMLPATADTFAIQEIETMLAEMMPHLVDQPRLVVRIHPRLAKEAEERLGPVVARSGFEGRLQIIEEANLAPADTRIEWADGGAERNTTRLWDAVDALAARTLPNFSRGVATAAAPEPPPPVAEEPPAPPLPSDPWPAVDSAAWYQPPAPHAPALHAEAELADAHPLESEEDTDAATGVLEEIDNG